MVKFHFLIMFDFLLEASTLIPKSDSVGERLKEVTFSLLNNFITSKKNDWLQLQLWKVSIMESFISQYGHLVSSALPKRNNFFLVTTILCKSLK